MGWGRGAGGGRCHPPQAGEEGACCTVFWSFGILIPALTGTLVTAALLGPFPFPCEWHNPTLARGGRPRAEMDPQPPLSGGAPFSCSPQAAKGRARARTWHRPQAGITGAGQPLPEPGTGTCEVWPSAPPLPLGPFLSLGSGFWPAGLSSTGEHGRRGRFRSGWGSAFRGSSLRGEDAAPLAEEASPATEAGNVCSREWCDMWGLQALLPWLPRWVVGLPFLRGRELWF